MATKNIVPRATGEGSIGTSAKMWGDGYIESITATSVTATTFTGALVGDVTGNADTATNATNAASAEKATKDGAGNNIVNTYLPAVVGAVVAFAGSTTPNGWLLCDGSNVSRTTYAALFAVIGTTYGVGDGSTTFGLPNLADKFIQGNATSGTVKSAGLPNIKGSHNIQIPNNSTSSNYILPASTSGAFATSSSGTRPYWTISGTTSKNDWGYTTTFDASRSSSVYSDDVTTVQPPALTMRYIIKY